MSKKIAITGHRPDKLPGGYEKCYELLMPFYASKIVSTFLTDKEVEVFVGGALGIDQIAMFAILDIPLSFIGDDGFIKPTLCEPFKDFWVMWPDWQIERYLFYRDILDQSNINIVCKGDYAPWKMQVRNQFMVDRADEVWAWWDGSPGGTANCIAYAKKQGKPIRNLRDEYSIKN